MNIRRAANSDINGIQNLLHQVLMVHHNGRPDLFKPDTTKYTDTELQDIIADDTKPIFVCTDDDNKILGYAFCVHTQNENNNILTNIKTLYIDDICVDSSSRGMHIGTMLYQHVLDYAKSHGYYNITLNVWSCNPDAIKFYESLGLIPYKIGMEHIL